MTEIDAYDVKVRQVIAPYPESLCGTCGAAENHYTVADCLESLVKRVVALERRVVDGAK